jgi:hypothetical protein
MPAGAVLTGSPISGQMTYFGLGSALVPLTIDDVSDFLDGVEPSSDNPELDATTFRHTQMVYRAGMSKKGFSLKGKWSTEADAFFAALEGKSGIGYEYGPDGKEAGTTKISGLTTVLSYSGPVSSLDGITTFSVTLRPETTIRAVMP